MIRNRNASVVRKLVTRYNFHSPETYARHIFPRTITTYSGVFISRISEPNILKYSSANRLLWRSFSTKSLQLSDSSKVLTKQQQEDTIPATKATTSTAAAIPAPPTDHFSVVSAYGWLINGLQRSNHGLSSMGIATIFMAGEGFMANQPAVLLGRIVDAVSASPELLTPTIGTAASDTSSLWVDITSNTTIFPLFTLIAGSIIAKEVCTVTRKYLVEQSSTSLQKTAFIDQTHQLLAVRTDAVQDQRVGSLVVKLDKSVAGLIKLQKVTFLEGAPNLMAAAVALGYAFQGHAVVGGTMLGVCAMGGLVTAAQITSQKGIRIHLNEQKATMGAGVVDLLNNLGYIRASGMRELEEKRLDGMAEEVRVTEFKHHKYMMSFDALKNFVEATGFVAVVGGAVHLALSGEVTGGGSILTFAMLYSKATQPLQAMHKVLDQGHEAVIQIGIMGPLRALPQDPGLQGRKLPVEDASTPIVARGLTLARKGVNTNLPPVLQDLCLTLNKGEIVGIAGSSGSGKSTLLKCALGLIPDYQGSLTLLGAEARDIDKVSLSQALVYAQQEPFVLTGTIRDNLLATNNNTSQPTQDEEDELLLALQRASLQPTDFADWETHGLLTPIHEAGRNLSGGQRQRLALARVFYLLSTAPQTQMVILDEATSALDNTTEARVIDELQGLAREKEVSVVMVAHRLSTLRRADRVLMMESGGIVQDGSFEDLELNDGPFRDLLEAKSGMPIKSYL